MVNDVGWNLKIIDKYNITTIDQVKVIRKKYTTWNDNTYVVTITAKLHLTKKQSEGEMKNKGIAWKQTVTSATTEKKRPWTEKTKFIYA